MRVGTAKKLSARCAIMAILLGLPACAGLQEMTQQFEENWDTASIDATNPVEVRPIDPAIQQARHDAQIQKLAELSTLNGCSSIYSLAPKILGFDESNFEAQLKLADCDYLARDLAGAKRRYSQLLAVSSDVRVIKGLALTHLLDGKADKALELFQRAVDQGMNSDWQVHNGIGYAEELLGDFDAAQSSYLKAANLDASKGGPMNNLGMLYLRQERYDEAVGAFEMALNREPALEIASLNLRITHAVQGDYAMAFANASDPVRAAVLNSVGTAALAKGDTQTAKWLFQEALARNPVFYESAFDNLQRARLTPGP